jgi:small ligand-binding sensory domain FIST
MHIASALSTLPTPSSLMQDIEAQLALTGPPDVLLVFIAQPLAHAFDLIVHTLHKTLKPAHMLAVIGESIIGGVQEIEHAPAVSALAIQAPGVTLHSFRIADEPQWNEVLFDQEELIEQLTPPTTPGSEEEPVRAFFMFGDPFTTPIVQFLDACSVTFPGAPIIGGMASGMQNPGDTRLSLNDEIFNSGLVGIAFCGNVEIDCVVSQGCRPVGETFVVTKCHQNVIEQLDGKPALAAIEEMVQLLPIHDRQLMNVGGLQVGRVIDQGKGSYGRGDFLIRSLVGVKRETGAVLIGDLVRGGQTLQFHVRDGKSADEEMRLLLEGETMLETSPPVGGLLVTCNGRGTRMFDRPHHDVSLIRQILGPIPLAGFFAAGELGPVGEKNFIHGHTAALALFRETAKT